MISYWKRNSFRIIWLLKVQEYSITHNKKFLKECFKILELPENSGQEQVRAAYLALVKKYHPDNPDGDLKKFQEIDKAFRAIIDAKAHIRWNVEDFIQNQAEEEFDIKHTAPQHRQYLSYDGFGSGTIFQREKQYSKVRAYQAAENVMQHRISKATAEEKTLMTKPPLKHKIKTKYGFDRLVEDLIQESMSKGEFNNLSGIGKPLKDTQNTNPYVDFVTHKLNQVLIENGFTPEWITLQKEIREDIDELKASLLAGRKYLGKHPLEKDDYDRYHQIVQRQENISFLINKKIDKFNLLVPMLNKQMVRMDLQQIADSVLVNGDCCANRLPVEEKKTEKMGNTSLGLFGFWDEVFKK